MLSACLLAHPPAHTDTNTQTHRDTETQRYRDTQTQRHRERERGRDETETQRQRKAEIYTHRLTDSHKQNLTHPHSHPHTLSLSHTRTPARTPHTNTLALTNTCSAWLASSFCIILYRGTQGLPKPSTCRLWQSRRAPGTWASMAVLLVAKKSCHTGCHWESVHTAPQISPAFPDRSN